VAGKRLWQTQDERRRLLCIVAVAREKGSPLKTEVALGGYPLGMDCSNSIGAFCWNQVNELTLYRGSIRI